MSTAPAKRQPPASDADVRRNSAPGGSVTAPAGSHASCFVYCACHQKAAAAPAAPTRAIVAPGRSVYWRPRSAAAPVDALCTAPATQKAPAAPAAPTRAAALPGRSVHCACHEKGSATPTLAAARPVTLCTLCCAAAPLDAVGALCLPHQRQLCPQCRTPGPQLLQEALCTAPSTQKEAGK